MLNFNNYHQFAEGNINEKSGKKVINKFVIGGLIVANLLTFSGCAKDVSCDIKEEHAHYYLNDENLGRYIVSEKSSVSGLNRTDDYIPVNKEEAELLEFINKKELFKIDENKEFLENFTNNHKDYTEYRYYYFYITPMPIVQYNGKNPQMKFVNVPKIAFSWSDSINSNSTGEKRECHHVYYGYKIIKDESNHYKAVKSEPVDDISELPEGYDYINKHFYDIVNLYNKNQIFDYEDGKEDDKEIITEEEYYQAQNKSR